MFNCFAKRLAIAGDMPVAKWSLASIDVPKQEPGDEI